MIPFRFPWHSFEASATWGSALWLFLWALQRPGLHDDHWARLLLLLATLVWVPLSLSLLEQPAIWLQRVLFPAALCLVTAMQLPAGWAAGAWALPWLAVTAAVFINGIEALFRAGRQAGKWAIAAAQTFVIIGGLGTTADRLGLRPFNFDPAIILLTGVHFHYAGFVFPLLLGWAALRWPVAFFRYAAWLAVAAVPLTAAGITIAQVTRDFRLEALAAATVALAGWLGATGYGWVVWQKKLPLPARLCWSVLAISLIFSMTLSLGYALRPYWPLEWLNIPAMRALHGSANALGVAGGGLLGWHFLNQHDSRTDL